ncbi:MAG: ribose-5-phosphate isomerase RpiA [Bordetella sp.]|nr:MAG: ribose-5-phosphate isomerase RpiA [Bordetella sp.]
MFTRKQLKQKVANAAILLIKKLIHPDLVIGIGTGSTVDLFIEYLSDFKNDFLGAIASSEHTARCLKSNGIKLLNLNDFTNIPIYIDGADEINHELQMIKGGGGALTREKIIASTAKFFVCIADESKLVDYLGKFPIPVEVIPMARESVSRALKDLGGKPTLRSGYTTDNGNVIIDVTDLNTVKAKNLEVVINNIAGVVACGLFCISGADLVLLGTQNGIHHMKRNP